MEAIQYIWQTSAISVPSDNNAILTEIVLIENIKLYVNLTDKGLAIQVTVLSQMSKWDLII